MKILNKNLNDIFYFITPPIIYRFISKICAKKRLVNEPQLDSLKSSLDSLRKERFEYFFKDSVIDDFCDAMTDNFYTHTPHKAKNTENQKYLDQIENSGFVVLPRLINSIDIKKWMATLEPVLDRHSVLLNKHRKNYAESDGIGLTSKSVTYNEEELRVIHNIFDGVIRIWNPAILVPEIASKVEQNETINDICQAYLSNKTSISTSYIDVKCVPDALDSSVVIHCDSPFKILKVFIPLEDVEIKNAPFLYFTGSHKPFAFKLLKSFLEFTQFNKKWFDFHSFYGHIGLFKAAEQFPQFNIKPEIVTVKAGDVIIADTSGMHAATNLIDGRRVQLGLVYSMRGYDIGDIPEAIKIKSKDSSY